MIVVSPCHPATPAPLTVRRRRRTVTLEQQNRRGCGQENGPAGTVPGSTPVGRGRLGESVMDGRLTSSSPTHCAMPAPRALAAAVLWADGLKGHPNCQHMCHSLARFDRTFDGPGIAVPADGHHVLSARRADPGPILYS